MGKILVLCSLAAILASCAASKYHFEISGRYDDYNQEFEGPSIVETNPPFTSVRSNFFNYKAPGAGAQVGLLETTKITWARIGYFYSKNQDSQFTYRRSDGSTNTESVKLSTHGLEWASGFNIWWFKPYISINYLVNDFDYDNAELDNYFERNVFFFGAGMAMVFDLTDKTQLVMNGHFRGDTIVYSLGLAFYIGSIGEDQPSSSRDR